jgi:hypothetical protein
MDIQLTSFRKLSGYQKLAFDANARGEHTGPLFRAPVRETKGPMN